MNTELKSAWYSVVLVSIATILSLVVGATRGWPVGFAPLALLGFLGLTPVLFRGKTGTADCDERDVEVVRKASLLGGVCSYLAFVLGGMAIWFIHYFKGESSVSIHFLPGLVAAGWIVLCFVRSVFIISQYTPKALGADE